MWHRDKEILGGQTVFLGTRVTVRSLFDYLQAGDSIEEFLRQFPSVKKEQAVNAVRFAREAFLFVDEWSESMNKRLRERYPDLNL